MQPEEAAPCPAGHRAEFRYRSADGHLRCRLCEREYGRRPDVRARRAERRENRYRAELAALIDSGRLSPQQVDVLRRRSV